MKSIGAYISINRHDLTELIREIVIEVSSKIQAAIPVVPLKEKEFTVKSAAAEANLSESTIRRKIKSGELKSYHVGKKGKLVRIKESDLKALFVEREIKGRRF